MVSEGLIDRLWSKKDRSPTPTPLIKLSAVAANLTAFSGRNGVSRATITRFASKTEAQRIAKH